jgi:hypothetical protein
MAERDITIARCSTNRWANKMVNIDIFEDASA